MKKTILNAITALFTIAFFTIFASAAITVTNPALTGYIQDNITGTITITNTGTDTITNLAASTTGFGGYAFSPIPGFAATTLTSGQSTTYQFSIKIPITDARSLDPKTIGTIAISGQNSTSSVQAASTVTLDVKPRLYVSKVYIDVEGDREKVSEGEKVTVKRGDSISLEVTIENQFSSSSNIDFDDIDVTVISDNLNIDEDDQTSIDSGDDDMITFSFIIEDDADEGNEEVLIEASGYDDNSIYHEYIFSFDIDVDVPSREVLVSDAYFSPSIVTCDKDSTLYVELKNTGSRDLDDAMIIVKSDEDIIPSQYVKGLTLDEGDSLTKTMSIELPANTGIGNYLFYVTSYFGPSTSDDSDEVIVNLEVAKCVDTTTGTGTTGTTTTGTGTTTTPTPTPEEIIIQTQGMQNIPTGAVFATPKKESSFDLGLSNNAMLLLILVNLVVLAAVIMVIIAMNRR